jgi:hypothetical protein
MPQPMVFTWAVVVDDDDGLEVGDRALIARPGYRVIPVDRPLEIARRGDRAVVGVAQVERVLVGRAEALAAELGERLPAAERPALDDTDGFATVVEYQVKEIYQGDLSRLL